MVRGFGGGGGGGGGGRQHMLQRNSERFGDPPQEVYFYFTFS